MLPCPDAGTGTDASVDAGTDACIDEDGGVLQP
jgi:hypothetical protein